MSSFTERAPGELQWGAAKLVFQSQACSFAQAALFLPAFPRPGRQVNSHLQIALGGVEGRGLINNALECLPCAGLRSGADNN